MRLDQKHAARAFGSQESIRPDKNGFSENTKTAIAGRSFKVGEVVLDG